MCTFVRFYIKYTVYSVGPICAMHTCFRLAQKSMTLDDLERPKQKCRNKMFFSDSKTPEKFE